LCESYNTNATTAPDKKEYSCFNTRVNSGVLSSS